MKNMYTKRSFLKNVAFVSTGVAFLSSTSILNAFNGNDCPFDGYNPYSEEKNDLRNFFSSGNTVTVKGTIFNKSNLEELSNATIEVWHLSPNSKKYGHQAKMKVNSNGGYSFITDFPNREIGKSAKVYFKISCNNKVTFTELSMCSNFAYINNKHYTENRVLGEKMLPNNQVINGQRTIDFNIVI